MASNLYIATETLFRAYRSIIDENDISTINIGSTYLNTGIPDRMEFYRQQFATRNLTISEKMLSYVRKGGDVFATKQTEADIAKERELKDQLAADYIRNSIIENLPKGNDKYIESDEDDTDAANTDDLPDLPAIDSLDFDDNSHS